MSVKYPIDYQGMQTFDTQSNPQQFGPQPQQLAPPPQQFSQQSQQQFGAPPQQLALPPSQFGPPTQQLGPQQLGPPPQQFGPPQQFVPPPQQFVQQQQFGQQQQFVQQQQFGQQPKQQFGPPQFEPQQPKQLLESSDDIGYSNSESENFKINTDSISSQPLHKSINELAEAALSDSSSSSMDQDELLASSLGNNFNLHSNNNLPISSPSYIPGHVNSKWVI